VLTGVRGKERKRSKREREIQSFFLFQFFCREKREGKGLEFFFKIFVEKEREKGLGFVGEGQGEKGNRHLALIKAGPSRAF
jgi:hypothetical protein